MKNLLSKAFFGHKNLVGGLMGIGLLLITLGCNSASTNDNSGAVNSKENNSASNSSFSSEAVPSNTVVEGLVEETIEKFKDGVETGNFTELRGFSSSHFQEKYTVEQVAEGFKDFTKNRKRVVPILTEALTKNTEFDRPPTVQPRQGNSVLVAAGKFPAKRYVVGFDFEYVMLGGEWKLLKLVINIP